MSQCIVPNWNLKLQRQEQVEEKEEEEEGEGDQEGNRSSSSHHVLINSTNSHLVPMSNYEVAELTWENGQLAMHGLSGVLPTTKPTWGPRSNDTLESIVHQATISHSHKHNHNYNFNNNLVHQHDRTPAPNTTTHSNNNIPAASSSGRLPVTAATLLKKRVRSSESDHHHHRRINSNNNNNNLSSCLEDNKADVRSACGSASATFCRDNDTTMMTWASHESPPSLSFKSTKTTTTTADDDSACHDGISENRDEDREMSRGETGRSHSTSRRSRAAAVHNMSERRRRDRINQKMKTLQKMVPNASKTDKASMLDEVIDYLKQLQAQVEMMSSMRSMAAAPAAAHHHHHHQMMMPLGMQQHLQQMSMLARMAGMGVGLGVGMPPAMGMQMLDLNSMGMGAMAAAAAAARNAAASQSLPPLMHAPSTTAPPPPFLPPPFVPPHIGGARGGAAQPNSDASSNAASVPTLPDAYCAFLAQSMNMDLYSKMAALYRPQMNQTTKTESSPSRSNNVQQD